MTATRDQLVIAFVAFTGLKEDGSWPATANSMVRALEEAGHTVIRIKPSGPDNPLLWKAIQGIYRIAGKRFQSERQELVIRQLAASVNEQLKGIEPDLLLSSSSLPLPFIEVKCPMAFWTDATFTGMLGFYPEFSKLSKITVRNGSFFETLALERAELAIYSSDWAARSAIEDHGADPAKVHVIPFGPNISRPPDRESVQRFIMDREREHCRLLFIGYDWERKQGPLVVEVHHALRKLGISSRLTVIGNEPDIADRTGITVLGMLDKKIREHDELIRRELARSHFLVVLSKAECFGMVYCEASAYGIPSIACDVGGVSSAVRHGTNGLLYPLGTSAGTIAAGIAALWNDREVYQKAAINARQFFEENLNWSAGVKRISGMIDKRKIPF